MFKTLRFRVLAIAFLGTHIPLIAILIYFLLGPGKTFTPLEIILVVLAATLAGAIGTLLFIDLEVRPVRDAAKNLGFARVGYERPILPKSKVWELKTLFAAIDASFGRALTLTETHTKAVEGISHHVEAMAGDTQKLLTTMDGNPTWRKNEHSAAVEKYLKDMAGQVESIRSMLHDIRAREFREDYSEMGQLARG